MHSLASTSDSWLSWFFKGLLILGGLILVGRLAELQIIKGAYYESLADNNRLRRIPIHAARGRILDRNGEVLVDNKEVKFTVDFTPKEGFEKKEVTNDTPEKEIITEWQRDYKLGARFAHTSGILGEVDEQEVGKVDPNCQEKGVRVLGTLVGKSGLELRYDCLLRGVDGEELVEVDTFGNKIRVLGRKQSQAGEELHTTIDQGLQKIVSSRLNGEKGAIIATTPSGEVLALYSSPSFDPNLFVQKSSSNQKEITKLLSDENLPLFNRTIGGSYHPGSIFKTLTALAALEDGVIDKSYTYDDQGFIKVNDFTYNNWYFTQYGSTEGVIDLSKAIARSTDTLFYKIGELSGIDNLVKWSRNFKLDQKTGIDLPGEISGLVPSPEWKKAVKGERWFLGNTYHFAIGQGDLSLTPLSAHTIAMTIANQGQLCTPHLSQDKKTDCTDLEIDPKNLDYVIQGMVAACQTGGTAYPFFDFSPTVACKTGT